MTVVKHNSRIIAVLTLYNLEINKLTNEDAETTLNDVIERINEDEIVEIDYDYSKYLLSGVLSNLNQIDEIISSSLVGYTIDRLSYVDRAIIRVAVYEMQWLKLNKSVAIDAALEITKDYSNIDDKQVKFNNKLLDNISKKIS